MIHFDEVKEKTIEYLKSLEKTSEGEFYVIRDVYGKVAVYVTGGYQPETVRNQLAEVIGQNWIGQVRSIEKSSILFGEVSGNVEQLEEHIYYGERPLVKKNWNNAFAEKVEGDAKTVTFYSYKGGVGRTTTLALSALQMARKGKKIVVIEYGFRGTGLIHGFKARRRDGLSKIWGSGFFGGV